MVEGSLRPVCDLDSCPYIGSPPPPPHPPKINLMPKYLNSYNRIYNTTTKYSTKLTAFNLNLTFLIFKYIQNVMKIYKTLVIAPMHQHFPPLRKNPV